MYCLWKEKRINIPSDYWNLSLGDKIFLRAFYEKEIEDKNNERKEIRSNKIPVFLTESI
ncbi:hypothetical protein [Clostridium scatologenes]|uniref:hypothetical protein n=1 Tax=Clostridium scatologenes TaxID=1548 RepID=UPI00130E51CC|nr:hypothetical protein [Clostridium scatologenes]